MSVTFSIKEVAETLEMAPESGDSYLDLENGTIVYVSEDDQMYLDDEDGEYDESAPDWQKDHLKDVRRIFNADQVFRLPTKYEVNNGDFLLFYDR